MNKTAFLSNVPEAGSHREGLRFQKLDLHVHTRASKCFGDTSSTPDDVVREALGKDLAGIAITDHNSGDWIDLVKQASAKTPLVVFPGVEITCVGGRGGIHIIGLFDPSCGRRDVESLLGDLGLKPAEYGDTNALVQKDPISVIQTIRRRGGLAVLAHANSTKGALCDMQGQQRTTLVQCPELAAAEGTDFQDDEAQSKHRRVVDLLDGSDPTFQRKLAVYQASDNPSGVNDGEHAIAGIGTRCAYFKLDRVNLEGLRQCLADPDVRIRQDYKFTTFSYPRIAKVMINSGFLDGADTVFHEGLNSILGAKGAGKSLLIEFLRFAMNQPPSNAEILADHNSKLKTRLGNYGSVLVVLTDETGSEFSLVRSYNPAEDHPYASGEAFDPAQLFPILFLSQNEIIKIAESEDEQIAFIDRFFDFRRYQQEISDLESQLEQLDGELAESLRAYQAVRQLTGSIATAKKEIEHLDAALKNPVFDIYTHLELKDRAMREQSAYLKALNDQLAAARKTVAAKSPPVLPAAFADDPALKRMRDLCKRASDIVVAKLDEAISEFSELTTAMSSEHQQWLPQFQGAKNKYDETVQKEGGDYKNLAQKRAKFVKDLEDQSLKLATLQQKSDRIKEISTLRRDAIESLGKAHEQYTKERQSRCAKIEEEAAGRLTVRIRESSNTDEFRRRLMALKRGSHLREAEIEQICQNVHPGAFVRAIIRHGVFRDPKALETLAKAVEIDADRMRALSEFLIDEFRYEEILALEYKALPQDRPEIRYNVGQTTYESLDRLSVGQKCTAMLIIALSDGTVPIIIDQPEDSLDIRSIWEDMCCRIRRGKERRQFIFTTHSSSLAVASDTDKFLIMEAEATHGKVLFSGSMDHSPISDQVMKYLEGGIEAYRTKYGKYQAERKP